MVQKISKKEAVRQQRLEVSQNFEAIQELLPELIAKNLKGKYALMRKRKIIKLFDDSDEALIAGHKKYRGKPFSVQDITDEPVNLGVHSHLPP